MVEVGSKWDTLPSKGDLSRLKDNKGQAIAFAAVLGKMTRDGTRETYNAKIAAFVARGVFKLLDQKKLDKWTGLVDIISHNKVPKPSSVSTAIRVFSNSSAASGPSPRPFI